MTPRRRKSLRARRARRQWKRRRAACGCELCRAILTGRALARAAREGIRLALHPAQQRLIDDYRARIILGRRFMSKTDLVCARREYRSLIRFFAADSLAFPRELDAAWIDEPALSKDDA